MQARAITTGTVTRGISSAIRSRQLDTASFEWGSTDFESRLSFSLDTLDSPTSGRIQFDYTLSNEAIGNQGGFQFNPIIEFRIDGVATGRDKVLGPEPGLSEGYSTTLLDVETSGVTVSVAIVGLWTEQGDEFEEGDLAVVSASLEASIATETLINYSCEGFDLLDMNSIPPGESASLRVTPRLESNTTADAVADYEVQVGNQIFGPFEQVVPAAGAEAPTHQVVVSADDLGAGNHQVAVKQRFGAEQRVVCGLLPVEDPTGEVPGDLGPAGLPGGISPGTAAAGGGLGLLLLLGGL